MAAALALAGGCGLQTTDHAVLTPSTALITGELGYPSEWVPPMSVYARDVRSGDVFIANTHSSPSITGYALEVSAPATYRVFAWTVAGYLTEESLGSCYIGGCARTGEVPDDPRMLEVTVLPGDTLRGIDIFRFDGIAGRVPAPPGN